jgi:hypothetical protein
MGSHGISEDLGWELYRLRFDVRSYHDPGCLEHSFESLPFGGLDPSVEPTTFWLEKIEGVVTRFVCVFG